MQKRYQVFLSSTFRDLEVERLEVMRALLELDCFPCGMEYFPASNDDQWSFIKDLIDQCDYYVVVDLLTLKVSASPSESIADKFNNHVPLIKRCQQK
jgi:hypothetical protein